MANELLYNTTYVTPRQTDTQSDNIKQRDRDSFRKFWEESKGLPGLKSGPHKILNYFDGSGPGAVQDNTQTRSVALRDDQKSRPSAYQRSKIVCIDSKDRDQSIYPDPALFRVYFGEQFTNVSRIQLLDTQLPNTEQLIRSQPANKRNDTISWRNGPDEEDHDQVYSITMTPGNYTPDTFANEIVAKTSTVARNLPSQTEKVYHSFDVVVNGITNTFVMRQNRSSTLANPLSTTAGSPIVKVGQTSHGFYTGQIVNFSGCANVAGLSADVLNTAQVISVNTEKIDSLIYGTDSSTEVIYGTTSSTLNGTVTVNRGESVVKGHGTKFLTDVSVGEVINIGYFTYTVDTVISDSKLVVEEILQESFNEFTLIKDLSGKNQGMVQYAADTSLTLVNTIKTRVRNIGVDVTAKSLAAISAAASALAKDNNTTANETAAAVAAAAYAIAATALSEDSTYQSSINDLSLSIYNKIQKTIYIHDLSKSFKLNSTFASRDSPAILNSTPANSYETFNSFYLKNNIENFNVVRVTSSNNLFSVNYPTSTTTNITLPIGVTSTISFITILNNALPGWGNPVPGGVNQRTIQYDTNKKLFYFTPPMSGASVNVVANSYSYTCSTQVVSSFVFPPSNSASTVLGFPSSATTISGTVVISSVPVPGGSQIVITASGVMHILGEHYNLIAEINIGIQTFASITQLITLLNSIFLAKALPLAASYVSGIQAVMIGSTSMSYIFQVAFPQQIAGGIATALGFDYTRVYRNLTIQSQSTINNIISEGYYSHKFLDYVNAVGVYKSRQARGTSTITNTSNVVMGNFDTFQGLTAGTDMIVGTSTSSVVLTGQMSHNTWQLISNPVGVSTVPGASYFQSPLTTSASTFDTYRVTGQHVDLYAVQYVSSRFLFTRTKDGKVFNDSQLEYELGRTMCFDLRSLASTNRFKLSKIQNGNWGNTSLTSYLDTANSEELLLYTRYICNGQFLQLCIPESATLLSPYLYIFDELNDETITTAQTVISDVTKVSHTTFYFSLVGSQLCVSQAIGGITSETPVLNLKVGQIYILDYSAIVSSSTSDTLLISTSIDGSHFNGGTFMSSSSYQFVSAGTPATTANLASPTASAITLNLSADNGPFPDRIFYYLQNLAGAGGDGYLSIGVTENSGSIAVVKAGKKEYNLFSGGPVLNLTDAANLVGSGSTLVYSPFSDSLTVGNTPVNLLDSSNSLTTSTVSNDLFNVTLDNNRFIVIDTALKQEITVSINIGIRQMADITDEIASQINSAFNITTVASQWNVVFDDSTSTFTFVIQNGRRYSFQFFGIDSNGIDLFNSAAELLGFARTETPNNTSTGSTNISSSVGADFSENSKHSFSVNSMTLSNDSFTAWSESLLDPSGTVYPFAYKSFFSRHSGTQYTADFALNDVVLLGTDYDQTFTVVAITNDYEMKLNSNVAIVSAGVDATTGLPIAAPTTTYQVKLYRFNNTDTNKFSTNDEVFFNRSLTSRSVYDYDYRLVGSEFLATRISPVKLSIPETDILLTSSETDTAMTYNYISINNHDMAYVLNNSRYSFTVGVPATSTATNKGGNPISVGTGVKFQLLFSQTNTPGNILGFMNVGVPVEGDTGFKTVQSNTLPDTSTSVVIVRSEPGTGSFSGNLKIVTATAHTFQFGDIVYITNHTGSSNDAAVNSDEGYTINLDPAGTTFIEVEDGIKYTRGYFYIPLNISSGGFYGEAFRRKLYRPFALAGDNYVYLTCPLLSSLNTTSSKVQNVFAKIALNSPPGSIIFNSFTSTEKIFGETPIAFLDHLDFTVVDGEGQLFLFNNTDWSCSIKITIASSTLPSTGISSRTDLYNEVASGNSTSNLQTHS